MTSQKVVQPSQQVPIYFINILRLQILMIANQVALASAMQAAMGRHDSQHNDTQHNNTQNNNKYNPTLIITTFSIIAECCYV